LLLRYNELDRTLDELSTIIKSIRSHQQQSTDDFDQFLSIETDIEKHSTVISNLLAFDHNLLNETDISQRNIHSLSRTVQTLEQHDFEILLKSTIDLANKFNDNSIKDKFQYLLTKIDNNEINQNINRTKLHCFIRIYDYND
ncbi:unnamed protein product, partial [Rotaria sp. Silwood2]